MLGGWLHRHTCFVANKLMRGERRRRAREEQVALMDSLPDHTAANLATVAPILDEAMVRTGVIGNKQTGVMGYNPGHNALEKPNPYGRDNSICDAGAECAIYGERTV